MGFIRELAWIFGRLAKRQSLGVEKVVAPSPSHGQDAESIIQFGISEAAAGRHMQALGAFEQVLAMQPEAGFVYRLAGEQAKCAGDIPLAVDYLQMAIHYLPEDASAKLLLARVHLDARQPERAVGILKELSNQNPADSQISFEIARCHYLRGDISGATHCLEGVLAGQSDNPFALNLLGLIQARDLGNLDSGERLIRKALEVRPGFTAAMSNLGWILAERGNLTEAIRLFDLVLVANPEDGETRLMSAHAKLKRGLYRDGWRDFGYRHSSPLAIRRQAVTTPYPVTGPPPSGSRLLVLSEQGIGDQIMFASCISDLIAGRNQINLECHSKLHDLFARSFPSCRILSARSPIATAQLQENLDFQLYIGDLPGMYRKEPDDFPMHAGYLVPDPQKVRRWRARLEALGSGPYIGVSWRGGTDATRRGLRSIPPEEWAPLLHMPGQYVSLQYGECAEDLRVFHEMGIPFHHWQESIDDYDDTAALLMSLDCLVSVCTSVVHLAGALGRPAHVLTPAQAEWRYQDRGSRMPWYPSVRLYRQDEAGIWQTVMSQVASVLDRSN